MVVDVGVEEVEEGGYVVNEVVYGVIVVDCVVESFG